MELDKDQFHPNLIRKVESKDLPEQKGLRLKDENMALMFYRIRSELKDRTGNSGNQKTLEFILRMAYSKLEDLEELDQELDELSQA